MVLFQSIVPHLLRCHFSSRVSCALDIDRRLKTNFDFERFAHTFPWKAMWEGKMFTGNLMKFDANVSLVFDSHCDLRTLRINLLLK